MALGSASQECDWPARVLKIAIYDRAEISLLLFGKQVSIKMTKIDNSGDRIKHINIEFHLVADRFREKHLVLKYCASGNMTANIFTEPLDRNF